MSFLSQPDVVAASRSFVCIRLATYEDKDEGAFLKAFRVTRSGELENTVFAILSPDGTRRLARASRSAHQTLGDAGRMVETMRRIAAEYAARGAGGAPGEVPKVANVRLAVNVAACDNRPLVLVFGRDAGARAELERRLAAFAWSDESLGRFVYASGSAASELADLDGATAEPGVLVIQPDEFGRKGKGVGAGRRRAARRAGPVPPGRRPALPTRGEDVRRARARRAEQGSLLGDGHPRDRPDGAAGARARPEAWRESRVRGLFPSPPTPLPRGRGVGGEGVRTSCGATFPLTPTLSPRSGRRGRSVH